MTFKGRVLSRAILKASKRLDAMLKIDKDKEKIINYGSEEKPLTSAEMKAKIDLVTSLTSEYNQMLEKANSIGNKLNNEEAALKVMNSKVLSSAKGKFDSDADEIEQLGGTRSSERKRPVRKNKTAK